MEYFETILNKVGTVEIVLVRHGSCEWNEKLKYSGWYDTSLTEKGRKQAKIAAMHLKCLRYKFDIAYTSLLSRAQETLQIILDEIGQRNLQVIKTWKLNERHYGALTGLSKPEILKKYGEEKFLDWIRHVDAVPPPMQRNHPCYTQIITNRKYKQAKLNSDFKIPAGESLQASFSRTFEVWANDITPLIGEGKRVLIVAHAHIIQALVQKIEGISPEEIVKMKIPNAIPLVYTLDRNQFTPLPSGSTFRLIGDPEIISKIKFDLERERRNSDSQTDACTAKPIMFPK